MMMLNRSSVGGVRIPAEYDGIARATTALFIAAALSLTWLLPQGAALRFTRSDVQFLFPAPLSRRDVLAYKLGRLLIGAGAMALPLTLIVGPVRLLPAILFYIKVAA